MKLHSLIRDSRFATIKQTEYSWHSIELKLFILSLVTKLSCKYATYIPELTDLQLSIHASDKYIITSCKNKMQNFLRTINFVIQDISIKRYQCFDGVF